MSVNVPADPRLTEARKALESLFVDVRSKVTSGLDDEAQGILAELIILTEYVGKPPAHYAPRLWIWIVGRSERIRRYDAARESNTTDFMPQVRLAAECLLASPPNKKMARIIVDHLSSELVPGISSPAVWVMMGLGLALLVGIPSMVVFIQFVGGLFTRDVTETGTPVLWVLIPGTSPWYIQVVLWSAIVGALGSIVSIMIRVNEFENLRSTLLVSRYVLLFTGLFKPIIGAAFAVFVNTVIISGMLPLVVPDDEIPRYFFWFAVSFVAGFSERFAKDVASRTEELVGGARSNS